MDKFKYNQKMNEMIFRYIFLTILLSGFLHPGLKAQTDNPAQDSIMYNLPKATETAAVKMNIIKLNLLSPFFKNISIQYERVINKFLSVAVSARYMPGISIPYVNLMYNLSGSTDPATEDAIKGMRMSNFAISPEVRFYVGKKGYGRGFYVAPNYRYAQFKINNLQYIYTNYPAGDSSLTFSGNLNVHYGGVLLGAQWALGKHLSLDWWFFGPLVGIENSDINISSSLPLSEEDQNDLRQNLENLNIPHTQKTVNVNENGGSLKLHGLMAGFNFGLALGVKF